MTTEDPFPEVDAEHQALIDQGMLYNPNTCEAATWTGTRHYLSPLVGRYEDVMHGLAESLTSSRESYDLLYDQHSTANKRIHRLERAMQWFLDEYEVDQLTRDVFSFAIHNGQGLS